ncbi:MAG: pantetheine-phosphate adenylyltransferase, partial [Candidatus Thermoplasmatota archaeon]|nr:pantetheine-phosphate adenylyltransferase [Candidatus Thermoplasmatota archaeon]
IDKSLEIAGEKGFVFIGVTNGEFIKAKRTAKSLQERKQTIEKYIRRKNCTCKIEIKPIGDKYGPSVTGDFDAIIVSPETRSVAEEINIKRKGVEKKPLKIFEIPFVLADDNLPISSTRIRNKEINDEGRCL